MVFQREFVLIWIVFLQDLTDSTLNRHLLLVGWIAMSWVKKNVEIIPKNELCNMLEGGKKNKIRTFEMQIAWWYFSICIRSKQT